MRCERGAASGQRFAEPSQQTFFLDERNGEKRIANMGIDAILRTQVDIGAVFEASMKAQPFHVSGDLVVLASRDAVDAFASQV